MPARRSRPTLTTALSGDRTLAPLAATYIHNLIVNTRLKRADAFALQRLERFDIAVAFEAWAPPSKKKSPREGMHAGVRGYLQEQGRKPLPVRPPAVLRRNVDTLGDLLALSPVERAVLTFLVTQQGVAELQDMTSSMGSHVLSERLRMLSAAINQPVSAVRRAVHPASRLAMSGLLNADIRRMQALELRDGLAMMLLTPRLTTDLLLREYFPADRPAELAWADFAHLGDAPQLAAELISRATKEKRPGVNVLFYGATGTGKTELARLIAARCGLSLHAAGRANEDGESADANERLSSLLLGHRLLREAPALLLFDEWEDLFNTTPRLFGGMARSQMSKLWFNELLDTTPVPTVWVTNSIEGVDPAFLRRFTYAIEFKPLGARQRARALQRHLGSAGLPEAEVAAVAERFEVSPAQLGAAVASARSLHGAVDRKTLEQLLAPGEKLVAGPRAKARTTFDASRYRLDALNAKEDLVGLASALEGWQPGEGPGLSLCLSGPPGTGKSEFAKYLAHRMGRRVVYRRVSDLVSMWVGETEKNLARAFEEAEQDDALLLFDEADSFLQDRRGAHRSWEISQVNEFLQQLERFRGVVVCTTNLMKHLDEASLRRFVFKVEFRWLKPEQAVALFDSQLGPHLEAPADEATRRAVSTLGSLAPGDFAAVTRRLGALRKRVSPREALELLRGEVAVKQGAPRPVGFAAA